MYSTTELAAVAIDEFRRGLQGLTVTEAILRQPKGDGGYMNAISWIVQHVGAHWHNVALAAGDLALENRGPARDGTPPQYENALALFDTATADLTWIANSSNKAMSRPMKELRGESVGTFLARAILHTWFHTGEINAVRQLLGHPAMSFVGDLHGRLGWLPEP